ncbi:CHASE2 domain-containing protein [Coleofasciculus sp. LEGE 07092]|uniref:CHASE2 domain-containing protein n=1 Tax=Coleofasciculus sp. LEGE 07081 TaxID=2777967 RepID=UPI001882B107|nr:CHASE2 domain-containing protein [Coleofasciculus sp. LEGE 07081]MBE9151260.1 CHASE2 domain-containing protein [Coleofasciculus sp. LEGE 07092]
MYETAPISLSPQPEESEVGVEQLNERDNNLEPRNTREGRQGLDKADSEDKPSISEDYQKNKGTRTENNKKIKNKKPIWSNLGRVIWISLLSTIIVTFAIRSPGMLRSLELVAYDLLMRWRPYELWDDRIIVVGITDAELREWDKSEIPDLKLKQLLQTLREKYKPRIIGLDIYRDKPHGVEFQYKELINEINKNSSIILACKADDDVVKPGIKPPPGVPTGRLGFSDILYDDYEGDKVVRRHLLEMRSDNKLLCDTNFPLSYQLAVNYLKQEGIEPNHPKGYLYLNDIFFKPLYEDGPSGGYHKEDPDWGYEPSSDYEILLNYRNIDKPNHYSYTEVKNGDIEKEALEDRVVIIGYLNNTEDNEIDMHSTPYGQMPGVFLHAHMVSQIISAAKRERQLIWFWEPEFELLWTWLWSFIFGILFLYFQKYLHRVLIVIFILTLLLIICWYVFSWFSGWIPLVPPLLAFALTGICVVRLNFLTSK